MKSRFSNLNIGPRLTLTFFGLVMLIFVGNGLLVWQFRIANMHTDRLTGANQQVIAVLRLQQQLLSFHQTLAEIIATRDAHQISVQVEPLRETLLKQIERTRTTLSRLPSGTRVDPAFVPTLDAIAIDLPSQVEALTSLADLGAWEALRIRLASGMRVMESQIAILVKSIDQESNDELADTMESIRDVQRRIFTLVPLTTIGTFFIAAFFAWNITRRIVELRLEERGNERMRIACELHDNLLQSTITAKMLIHLVFDQLPPDSGTKPSLGRVASVLEQAIEEGRNTIRGFRRGAIDDHDLSQAFSRVQEELQLEKQIDCRIYVKGQPRALRPVLRSDIYSIGREALVNSFRHSKADRIEVEIQYASQLRVSIRDDGCGIEPALLQSGRDGHFGLIGMHERAERIGAKLKVRTGVGEGTEVELCVSGSAVFESPVSNRPWMRVPGLHWRKSKLHPNNFEIDLDKPRRS